MTFWDDKFNAMPYEQRHIANMSSIETNIRFLEQEKLRLVRRHKESIKEINARVRNLRDDLDRATRQESK